MRRAQAAHHGSHDSTTAEFLKAVQPKAALISAGVDNRYGHPHEETLERLKEAGCSVYSTQENGTLTVGQTDRSEAVRICAGKILSLMQEERAAVQPRHSENRAARWLNCCRKDDQFEIWVFLFVHSSAII